MKIGENTKKNLALIKFAMIITINPARPNPMRSKLLNKQINYAVMMLMTLMMHGHLDSPSAMINELMNDWFDEWNLITFVSGPMYNIRIWAYYKRTSMNWLLLKNELDHMKSLLLFFFLIFIRRKHNPVVWCQLLLLPVLDVSDKLSVYIVYLFLYYCCPYIALWRYNLIWCQIRWL